MYKKDVIDHFGTQRAVAKALGISDAAVSVEGSHPRERRLSTGSRYSWRPEVSRKRLPQSGISKLLFNSHGPHSRRNAGIQRA